MIKFSKRVSSKSSTLVALYDYCIFFLSIDNSLIFSFIYMNDILKILLIMVYITRQGKIFEKTYSIKKRIIHNLSIYHC